MGLNPWVFFAKDFRSRTTLFSVVCFLCLSANAVAQSPKWKSWAVKGDTLYNHEDYKGAVKAYNKAIDLSKLKDKEAYRIVYKRAVCFFSLGDYKDALKDLDIFAREFPDLPQEKLIRAFIYRELGDDEKQLSNLELAMEFLPASADMLKWRGLLYLQKDDFEKAKSDILLARKLQDDPEVETYLGLIYYNLEQMDSSFVCFNASIGLDATYLPPYLYAGSISLEMGDYELSVQYLNLALRLEPKNKEALFYKGAALIELKKVDEGCQCLTRSFYAGMDDAGDYLKEYCYKGEN